MEGHKSKERASIEIGCTVRHINRLVQKYKKEGKASFIHGNRGRKPSTTIPLNVKKKLSTTTLRIIQILILLTFVRLLKMISISKLVIQRLINGYAK